MCEHRVAAWSLYSTLDHSKRHTMLNFSIYTEFKTTSRMRIYHKNNMQCAEQLNIVKYLAYPRASSVAYLNEKMVADHRTTRQRKEGAVGALWRQN